MVAVVGNQGSTARELVITWLYPCGFSQKLEVHRKQHYINWIAWVSGKSRTKFYRTVWGHKNLEEKKKKEKNPLNWLYIFADIKK